MARQPYYINGVGVISPQKSFDNSEFLPEITSYKTNTLLCVTPDFKDLISPNQIRRLSRMLRIGLSAALICVKDSGGIHPDGIITGTGYGLLNDTEKFLAEILQQDEKHLTPTFFMQSTYNALGGMVGLSLKCTGYNNTYVSKGVSFEMAIHDAMMQLNENPSQSLLVGAFDEVDEVQYKVNSRVGHYKDVNINNLDLFASPGKGSLQGEGAAFFLISGNATRHTWCAIADVKMIFKPDSEQELSMKLYDFLKINGLAPQDVDVFISGMSGDTINDAYLESLGNTEFSKIPLIRFKHLCGEYCTASAFGSWIAISILKKQQIPSSVQFNDHTRSPIKNVLLISQYMGRNYSFILFQA